MTSEQPHGVDQTAGALPIAVRSATGVGRTALSAFDAALLGAGVANYNLVRLSSVIPQQAVVGRDVPRLSGEHGDRMYAVWAEAHADLPGDTAWAGVGWTRDKSGKGLFVEHHSASEESLVELIHLSLEDMTASRGGGYGPIESVVASAHYEDRPACALVIATYEVQGWGPA